MWGLSWASPRRAHWPLATLYFILGNAVGLGVAISLTLALLGTNPNLVYAMCLGGSFCALQLASMLLFKQPLAPVQWVGVSLVATGLVLLARQPELHPFAVYASDGHSHSAAIHEKPIGGKVRAVNHIYSLNLRSHSMAHLALTQPAKGKKKEHEITTLKRVGAKSCGWGKRKE
jgi:multidrug transporter EmrE-like cation transporter